MLDVGLHGFPFLDCTVFCLDSTFRLDSVVNYTVTKTKNASRSNITKVIVSVQKLLQG